MSSLGPRGVGPGSFRGQAMQVILWEFRVRPEGMDRFLAHYSPSGTWAELFRKADGFRGTELLSDPADPTRFLSVDRWDSPEARELFLERFGEEYVVLDRECEGLTVSERRLGEFEAIP